MSFRLVNNKSQCHDGFCSMVYVTSKSSTQDIAALSSAELLTTVQRLRTCVGAYRLLSCVVPNYSDLRDSLDQATAGKYSREKVAWSDQL